MAEETQTNVTAPQGARQEETVLGGGCFWCLEPVYEHLQGVISVTPGYAGGRTTNPSYEEVCSGKTGHAEVVHVVFDPSQISYRDLLEVFFSVHDPTTLNRQGADVGEQYRSVIFTYGDEQAQTASDVIRELTEEQAYDRPIVTQVEPAPTFYPAEEYHHHYFEKHPTAAYCAMVIGPKVAKFRKKYAERLKA